VIGIIHIKDLVGLDAGSQIELRELARAPHHVPETMPISHLLRHFQKTHQLMAMVVDEHGTVVGVVTLENVLEQIIGPVEDEFDTEPPDIIPDGAGQFIVQGSTALDVVNKKFGLDLDAVDVDTMAGIMLERVGRVLEVGDRVDFDGILAEVIEVEGARATRIRLTLPNARSDENEPASEQKDPRTS
jgi:CBS domain containing-hemolysin-like protein